MNKKILVVFLTILSLSGIFASSVFAKPSYPELGNTPDLGDFPKAPEVPEIPDAKVPELPPQPSLPPCPQCDDFSNEPTPTPTASSEAAPKPTNTPNPNGGGGGVNGNGNGGDNGGGEVMGLSDTSSADYAVYSIILGMVAMSLGIRLLSFKRAVKIQR